MASNLAKTELVVSMVLSLQITPLVLTPASTANTGAAWYMAKRERDAYDWQAGYYLTSSFSLVDG